MERSLDFPSDSELLVKQLSVSPSLLEENWIIVRPSRQLSTSAESLPSVRQLVVFCAKIAREI